MESELKPCPKCNAGPGEGCYAEILTAAHVVTTVRAALTAYESAGVEMQRELIEAAFNALHDEPDAIREGVAWGIWHNQRRKAREMLDAEAYLDAVMMLKPEGCRVRVDIMEDGCGGAWVWWPTEYAGLTTPRYATPALALLAAICRDLGSEG